MLLYRFSLELDITIGTANSIFCIIDSCYWCVCHFPVVCCSHSSKLLYNDWRLPLYLASKFPDVARSSLLPGEFLEVGEIVECRVQKSDWNRARILAV